MWNTLKHIKKFTARAELEQRVAKPMFQIEDRLVYYHGSGFAVYYSPRCFRIEGIQRVEYGQPGEYAVGLYHFSDVEALRTELGLSGGGRGPAGAGDRRRHRLRHDISPTAPLGL